MHTMALQFIIIIINRRCYVIKNILRNKNKKKLKFEKKII